MKANDLSSLKAAWKSAQAQQQAVQAAERAAQLAALAKRQAAEREQRLFQTAIGRVTPLAVHPKATLAPPKPQPLALQHERDEALALAQSLSDGFTVDTLLDTDEHLSFKRSGVGPDVVRKLRRGTWSTQAELDLHGFRVEEAREQLSAFLHNSHKSGLRCVRVVHGKGLGSPGKTPVLKGKVHSWLVQKAEVLAFVQATASEGGAGALLVLLMPS